MSQKIKKQCHHKTLSNRHKFSALYYAGGEYRERLLKTVYKLLKIKGDMFRRLFDLVNIRDDFLVYQHFRKWLFNPRFPTRSEKFKDKTGRNKIRAKLRNEEILQLLDEAKVSLKGSKRMLDIGSDDAIITEVLGKEHEIKDVVGIDVQFWEGKEVKKDNEVSEGGVKFCYFDRNGLMPTKIGEFDVIFCLHTFHHVKNYPVLIAEIKRISKKGTILIFREHDNNDIRDYLLTVLEHEFHDIVIQGLEPKIDRFMTIPVVQEKTLIETTRQYENHNMGSFISITSVDFWVEQLNDIGYKEIHRMKMPRSFTNSYLCVMKMK